MDQWFIERTQHSFHSPKRLPSDDSDTGSQPRRASLKGDQEPTFVRLSGHCAGETHGSAASPTIHEGYDCRHGHSREAHRREQTTVILVFGGGRGYWFGFFEEMRVVHGLGDL